MSKLAVFTVKQVDEQVELAFSQRIPGVKRAVVRFNNGAHYPFTQDPNSSRILVRVPLTLWWQAGGFRLIFEFQEDPGHFHLQSGFIRVRSYFSQVGSLLWPDYGSDLTDPYTWVNVPDYPVNSGGKSMMTVKGTDHGDVIVTGRWEVDV